MKTVPPQKILLEVIDKANYCLSSYCMDEAVREVLPKYGDTGICRRVGFMKGDGKEAVYKSLRLASVSLMAS